METKLIGVLGRQTSEIKKNINLLKKRLYDLRELMENPQESMLEKDMEKVSQLN